MNIPDKILIDQISGGNVCALIRDDILVDIFADASKKNIGKNHINFGSIFYAKVEGDLGGANGSILDLGKSLKGFIKKSKEVSPGKKLMVQCVNTAINGKLPLFSKDILIKEKYVIFNPSGKGVSLSKKLNNNDGFKELKKNQLKHIATVNAMGIILRGSCLDIEDQKIVEYVKKKLTKYCDLKNFVKTMPHILFEGYNAKDRALAEWSHVKDESVIESNDCFEYHGVWESLESLKSESVELSGGGSLTIEPTRALISVDINTGKNLDKNAAFETNRLAMSELPRQLRLRGLGGIVNIDFAPLKKTDRASIISVLRNHLIEDPVKTNIVGWSPVGNLELNRKNERTRITEWLK